jgi:hypothetical protein
MEQAEKSHKSIGEDGGHYSETNLPTEKRFYSLVSLFAGAPMRGTPMRGTIMSWTSRS